jgi:hypothetical protein
MKDVTALEGLPMLPSHIIKNAGQTIAADFNICRFFLKKAPRVV